MDFSTNYCGAYWSDGKIQPSVAFGNSKPVSELDSTCLTHDREYALASSDVDRDLADEKFFMANINNYSDIRRPIYAIMVKYGNKILRSVNKFPMGHGSSNASKYYSVRYNMRHGINDSGGVGLDKIDANPIDCKHGSCTTDITPSDVVYNPYSTPVGGRGSRPSDGKTPLPPIPEHNTPNRDKIMQDYKMFANDYQPPQELGKRLPLFKSKAGITYAPIIRNKRKKKNKIHISNK